MLNPLHLLLPAGGVFFAGILMAAIWGIRGAIVLFVGGPVVAGPIAVLEGVGDYRIHKLGLDLFMGAAVVGLSFFFFFGIPAFLGAALGIFIKSKRRVTQNSN